MTVQENARFTVYRLVNEYDPKNGDLWDIARAIKNAFKLGAISERSDITVRDLQWMKY